ESRDVTAGLGQALDQAGRDRVGRHRHYNRDGRGRLLGSEDWRVTARHDEVDVEPDEFSRQRWEAGDVPFRVAVLQEKVLPLDVPQLPQALLQGFVARLPTERLRTPGENPDAIAFLRLLRCGWPAQSHEQSAQRPANDACSHGLFSCVRLPHAWCRVEEMQTIFCS